MACSHGDEWPVLLLEQGVGLLTLYICSNMSYTLNSSFARFQLNSVSVGSTTQGRG
jgi:hypothetical protein